LRKSHPRAGANGSADVVFGGMMGKTAADDKQRCPQGRLQAGHAAHCVGTPVIPLSGFRKLVSGQTTDMVRFALTALFASINEGEPECPGAG
jgi:hypothetical protein